MQLGIFSKTFARPSVGSVFDLVRGAGYQVTQLNMASVGLASLPAEVPDGLAAEVKAAARASGVTISAISATYNMAHPDQIVREGGRRAFCQIAAFANGIGTQLLTVCTGSLDAADQWRRHPDNGDPASWRNFCREMAILLEVAEAHDIMIGIEPELANIVSTPELARTLIDTMRSDRIQVVFDPANLFEIEPIEGQRRRIADALDLLCDRIYLAHAKDRLADGTFVPAGKGILDYEFYLQRLRGVGFDGPLIAHGLTDGEAAETARFLNQAMSDAS